MKDTLAFLSQLKLHNNREWFAAHREQYEQARATTDALTAKLITAVAEAADPRAGLLNVRDCTYRIYRDTRFSPDKTPYKTHIGIFINPPAGKKSLTGGYYFHIEPNNCFVAAGTVCLPSKVVTAIRQSIVDEIDEYRSIVEDPNFSSIFEKVGENPVKTLPRGISRDWPWPQYVRPRDFVASTRTATSLAPWIKNARTLHDVLTQAARFNRFINYTICHQLGQDE